MNQGQKVPSLSELEITDGCLVWKNFGQLAMNVGTIVGSFRTACQSPEFVNHCSNSGFRSPSFHVNNQLEPGNQGYDKFCTGVASLSLSKAEDTAAAAAINFGAVFHGTPTQNINLILRDGLDPQKRRGQAYGPGEYFSTDPCTSVSYCRGGLEMLVFVVVLPSKRMANQPAHYVVVNNNSHQLPIGTLKFQSVDHGVMSVSQQRREDLMRLSREVVAKSQAAQEARIKSKIIQALINEQTDAAAGFYESKIGYLGEKSRKEISWYAHQKLDPEVIGVYFQDLPEPIKAPDLEEANIQSLDDAEYQETKAKENLERAKRARHFGPVASTLPE